MFGFFKRLFQKRKVKKGSNVTVKYYKQYNVADNRMLSIYSNKEISEEKLKELKKFIEEKVEILDNPDTIISNVISEVVYTIFDDKAAVSLSIYDTRYCMHVMYID